ncbi:MAG: preprotein translocase subunit SecY [Candidatus Marinimicrobia bacterium]|nr:preprotein translocase subunit SecY [Candidatus Neomarinimicrobiota bacterium]MBT5251142.1 preprotein translocase subunit SecY [Candidatus Neomarinimicrobiota bacterium]MBT5489945.1 preprotein translocase subunit SecY [Candidatus Neomarinimicrobiota bacterium]MBT6188123.1 preprotein translocase subunit SecY [Candidatus Neomarinimicrobiota bacterium]MBT6840113.1 preprotein translocase subunit SecY [Candidatus Neomarinimicrobiota bacterium]
MIEKLRNIFAIPELRSKILFTLGILMIVRLGAQVPIPGIDPEALRQTMESLNDTFFGLFNMFTGGAFGQAAVFGLGIMPYISVSIVVQILQTTLPYFQRLAQEGESGRAKINQIIRYGTVILALVQSIGIAFLLESYGIVLDPGFAFRFTAVVSITTGTMLLLWLGEKITEHGIGNGISLVIMVGILAAFPNVVLSEISYFQQGVRGILSELSLAILFFFLVMLIILIQQGLRKIPVQYARRIVGRKVYGGQSTYLPLKINTAGVIPIIFAQSILLIPGTIATFMGQDATQSNFMSWFAMDHWFSNVCFALLIVFFTYFYTALQFDPNQVASTLKQQGGFIPGVKPGKKTAQFIENILTRVTLPGACFLGFIALMPYFLQQLVGLDYSYASFFGGTSLLIIVGVGLDTLSQVETHLLSRHYDGFLSKGKVRGRR